MEENKSQDIPSIPDDFIQLIRSKRLVLFVGAGISALCKYPLWDNLANTLIDRFGDEGKYDYQFRESIKNGSYDPIQKITILSQCDGIGEEKVVDTICELFAYDDEHCNTRKAEEIASYLFSFESSIVTTNADLVLDENDKKRAYRHDNSIESLSKTRQMYDGNQKRIVHIHGSIKDRENLVFTETQYAKKYLPTGKIGKFLTGLIKSNKTILFIGYSLREFELLKYIIGPGDAKNEKRLYKLEPYFHYQEKTKLELDKSYYKALGITILPYFIDKEGYGSLLNVLKDWTSSIKKQFSPIGDLYVNVADIISKAPTKNGKTFIIGKLNSIDPIFLQQKIGESKYYCEWIDKLWKQSLLFKPNLVFAPNVDTSEAERNYCSGLLIIRDYVSRKKVADSLETKISKWMKQSALLVKRILKSNKTTNYSDTISILLLDIVMCRNDFINDASISDPIIDLYISQNEYGAYTLAEDVIKARKTLIENIGHERLFSIINKLATSDERDFEHFRSLKTDGIRDFILTCPEKYYSEAISFLKKTNWGLSYIGCFRNFPFETNSFLFKEQMYGYWLLVSSKIIDNQVLKKDIETLIHSKKGILKKIGLCLLGLRFQENIDCFKNYMGMFFNDSSYVSDLIELLKRNTDVIRKEKELKRLLKKNLETATFGHRDDGSRSLFKKAISNVLANTDDANMFMPTPLSQHEKDSLEFFSSNASFRTIDQNAEVEEFFRMIEGRELDDAIKTVNNLDAPHSSFMDSSLAKAIDRYLDDKDFNSYKDRIKEFGDHYFLRYLQNKRFVPLTNEGAQRFAYLVRLLTKEEKKGSLDSILFSCSEFIKNQTIKPHFKEELVSLLDCSLIDLKETKTNDLTIGAVINSPLHFYWSILYDFSSINEETAKKLFLESLYYFYSNQRNNKLLKGVMALWVGFIYQHSNEKKNELFDYIFNADDSISSYKLFSYTQGGRDVYLEKLCSLDRFESFVLNTEEKGQERVSLATNIILLYLNKGLLEPTYKKVIRNKDIKAIAMVFRYVEKDPKSFVNSRFDSFVDGCIDCFESHKGRSHEVNMVLDCLVGLMEKEESARSDAKIWRLLSSIPSIVSYYHGSSITRLLSGFSLSEPDYCINFLDSLFNSYDSSYIYDGEIIQIFDFIVKTNDLRKKAERWLTIIGNKKPALYQELISKNGNLDFRQRSKE